MKRTGNVRQPVRPSRVFLEMFPAFFFYMLLSAKRIPATVSFYLKTLRSEFQKLQKGARHLALPQCLEPNIKGDLDVAMPVFT